MEPKNFLDVFLKSLLHCLYSVFVFLFLLPIRIWMKSVNTMYEQREKGSLNMENMHTPWPFISYLKAFLFDFFFDAMIVMSYVFGVIIAIVGAFAEGFYAFLGALVATYAMPFFLAVARDCIQLMLIPFRKFLSWGSKPAQYMDLEIKNKQ